MPARQLDGPTGPLAFQPLSGLPNFLRAAINVNTTAVADSLNGAFSAAVLSGQSLGTATISGHHVLRWLLALPAHPENQPVVPRISPA